MCCRNCTTDCTYLASTLHSIISVRTAREISFIVNEENIMDIGRVEGTARALILGGTRGLGRALATELLSRGMKPIIVGRSAEEAKKDSALLGAEFITADLADPACAETIMSTIFSRSTSLPSTFYWVAGEYHRGLFAEQHQEKMTSMFNTHLLGPLSVLREFHKAAKNQQNKAPYNLVVIASVFVHKPGKKHAILASVKAAKVNFCRVFAYELAEDLPGSMTLVVNPWAMRTEFFNGYPMDQKVMETFMDPTEVARIICDQEHALPKDAKPPVFELTLDRGEGGSIQQLIGPQPMKY